MKGGMGGRTEVWMDGWKDRRIEGWIAGLKG